MQGASKRQKLNYDKRGSYRVHDQVWLRNPIVPRGSSRKLHCPWQGPFKIVKCIGNVLYKIQDEKKLEKYRVVHFSRLEPFRQCPIPLTPPMPLVPGQSIWSVSESDTSELKSTITGSDSEDNSADQAESPTQSSTTENPNPPSTSTRVASLYTTDVGQTGMEMLPCKHVNRNSVTSARTHIILTRRAIVQQTRKSFTQARRKLFEGGQAIFQGFKVKTSALVP